MSMDTTRRDAGERDAPHTSPVTPEEDARTILINEVNWGAVLAGLVVALVAQLILNMLGVALGGASLNPQGGDNPSAASFSMGAGIWWAVSGIIASFVDGAAAGRLAGVAKESTAGWHGLISWALTTLVVFYLLTSTATSIASSMAQTAATAAGGMTQALGGAIQTGAQPAAPSLAQGADPFSSIERSVRGATGGQDPQALRDAAVSAVRAAVTGDPAQQQDATNRAADALARAQNIPVDQARTQVQQYQTQYRQVVDQAKQQATAAAETARKAVTQGSLFAAIALILGAICSWFGGRVGAVDPTITANRLRALAGRDAVDNRPTHH